jgi:dihydroneopterin aldolase
MFFRPMKGIIALDIDGTLTASTHALDQGVINILNDLDRQGWKFIFLTGRPFQWSFATLEPLTFSYALAVQNGALLLEMPLKKILRCKYLPKTILPTIEAICQDLKTDFVVYSGLENDDQCYYRPDHFPPSLLTYVCQRSAFLGEKFVPLQTFSDLPVTFFPSIKFFASQEQAFLISQNIERRLGLHAPPNRDPYNPDYFVIQATHVAANKGDVLREFVQLIDASGPIIAAGDDYNDRTMLELADVKIVMANAPEDLLKLADIIALPAKQQGIIQGLTNAVKLAKPLALSRESKASYGILGIHHYQLNCIIGIYPDERKQEQTLFVDAKVKLDLSSCLVSGQMDDTIDYTLLAQICSQLAEQNNYLLLETFASDILEEYLRRFKAVWAWVKVQKPDAIPHAAYAYVELERFGEEG